MSDDKESASSVDTKAGLRQWERQVLGAPAVPPSRVASLANGLRRRLLGLHRRSAPPPLQLLEALFASFDGHVLRALVELDLPDKLTGPTTVEELAGQTGTDRDGLDRLLRFAAARGLVGFDRKGRVTPNGVTAALRSDAPAPWRGWVGFATSDWFDAAWRRLVPSLEPDAPGAFTLAHGVDFFDYTTANQEAGRVFDEAMAAGATLQAMGLARILDWTAVDSVCDVGGGNGAALEVLLRYHSSLRATLFDLPSVVELSDFGRPGERDSPRSVVGGSFFDGLPSGHDRYLLLAIIHDWDDDNAVSILANVADAMGSQGEAVVVETVASEHPRDDFAAASDLLMFVLAGGRERTEQQYRRLFARAGLSISGQQLLPTGATAFTLRTNPAAG